jgi:glycosyltransferase involved in cell wall biosynthesis
MLAKPINNGKKEIVIGFTGFIHPWHGMDKALEAIAKHKTLPLKLICVGNGDILPDLKAQAASLGITDKVEFAGLVTRDTVLNYVEQFDIALQPDVTDYASPLKIFEYMAVGSLIIAPDCPNIREILSDKTALFFDKDNQKSFIETLIFAIEHIDELEDLRENVKSSIPEKKFVWQENVKQIIGLHQ